MAKEILRRACLVFVVAMLFAGVVPRAAAAEPQVIHQLRIYEIFDNNKQAFHERFHEHAMRIMAKYDFKIIAIWETRHEGRAEFAYLLQWPDRATLTDRWAKFMADKEWADIKKRTGAIHGRMVGEVQDRVLTVQDYSPNKAFQAKFFQPDGQP